MEASQILVGALVQTRAKPFQHGLPKDEPKTVKVGHWLAPDQHVAKAKEVSHPFDSVVAVESLSAEAVKECVRLSDDQLVQQRKLAVLKLKIRAKTFERQEQELHKTFQPWFGRTTQNIQDTSLHSRLMQPKGTQTLTSGKTHNAFSWPRAGGRAQQIFLDQNKSCV